MKTTPQFPRQRTGALASIPLSIFLALVPSLGLAADQTWDGGGVNSFWQTSENWIGDAAPLSGDVLVFTGTTRTATTNNFPVGTLFGGLAFETPAGGFMLSGNPITLVGDIVDNQVVVTETVNLALALNATRSVNVVDNGFLVLAGVVSGPDAGLTKTGDGLLSLTAANTFGGPVTISAGTLSVASDANLGTPPAVPTPGAIVINGGALRATSSFTLNANRGIMVGPPSGTGVGTFDVLSGATLTYGGTMANNGGGIGGLTKSSFGGLTLAGANTYAGPTIIQNGTATLDFTPATAPVSHIISPSSALTLGGANAGLGAVSYAALILNAKAGSVDSQAFQGTTVDVGPAIVRANGNGGTADLSLGTLTHNPGGVLNLVIPTATGGLGSISTLTPNLNGILGGWATVGSGSAPVGNVTIGTDWASVDASGRVVPYAGYTVFPTDGTVRSLATPATNLRIDDTSSGDVVIDAENGGTTSDLNTINLSVARALSIVIGSGNTLRLGRFGGLLRSDAATAAITWALGNSTGGANGVQNAGTLTAGGTPDTPGELVFTINAPSQSAGSLNVECAVTDNGSGPVTVVKAGPGSMKFRGHNSYSGGTCILQGRFQLAGSEIGTANPDGWGTGPVYIMPGGQAFPSGAGGAGPIINDWFIAGFGTSAENTGAIRLGNGFQLAGRVTLIGDARLGGGGSSSAAAGGAMILGKITGNRSLDIGSTANVGSGHSVVILANPLNDWTGNTTIVGRTGGTAGNARLALGANEVIPDGFGKGNVIIGNSGNTASACTLDLNGFSETVNGLSSAGNPANDFVQNNSAGTTSTLTLGNNDQTATYAGIIQDGAGVVAVTKIGRGVQTLTGANTYSGVTTVEGGTLAVSGAGSIANSLQILVNRGAALDVSGITGGFYTANSLAVNDGTLTIATTVTPGINDLSLSNATLQTAINPATINIEATTLTTSGAANVVDLAAVSGVTSYPATFTLIKYLGPLAGTGFNFTLGNAPSPSTQGYFVDNSANSSVDLVLLDGPKPLTWTGTASSDWDLLAVNWLAFGVTPVAFLNGDTAIFTDAAATGEVNLTTTLKPGAVTVNNVTRDYAFSGSGNLSGIGGLFKDGAGTLTLANSGINDFTGGIIVSNGTLKVGAGGTTGNLPAGSIANHGALVFSRSDDFTVSSDISGVGRLTQSGSGIVTLSGANSYEGATLVAQGILRAGSPTALGSNFGSTTVSSGATLDVNGQNLSMESVTVSGSGVGGAGAIVNSGSDQINALQSVTLVGDTTFGGTRRWDIRGGGSALNTGGTALNLTKVGPNQVSLVGVAVDSLGTIIVQEGTFSIETTTAFMGASVPAIDVAAGSTLQLYNNSGPLYNMIGLHGDGAATTLNNASGANTLSGTIALNGNCRVNVGGTSLTIDGPLGGGGSLTKIGASQLILAGTTTYSGPTTAANGTLVVNWSKGGGAGIDVLATGTLAGMGPIAEPVLIAPGGTLSPGDAVTPATALTINNAVTLRGTIAMDVNKSGTDFSSSDSLSGTTSLALGGTLQLVLGGDPLAEGDVFKLFSFSSASGKFTAILPAVPGPNLGWDTSRLTLDGTLRVVEAVLQPQIENMTISGPDAIISGGGGMPGGSYHVLTSTSIAAPLTMWVLAGSGFFAGDGSFTHMTAFNANEPQRFFLIQVP